MTTHTPMSIERCGDAGATGALVTPIAIIMARFGPPERLAIAERQRLMDACADDCRANYQGQEINWNEADRINAKIGETFTRRELELLLSQYRAAILNECRPT